jgi:hypothetical protein
MTKPPNKSADDYIVGYRKPPRHSQFKSGQSGNPKGRPKGQPSISELFMREAARIVRVQGGDKIESISKGEVVIRKLFNMSMVGDPRAMSMFLATAARSGLEANEANQMEAGEIPSPVVPDEATVRRMLSRFSHLKPK